MQRVRLDALQLREGRLFLHGSLFSGIAYEIQLDRVVANVLVEGGSLAGPAEKWDLGRPRVLLQSLRFISEDETDKDYPEEGVYLEGVPFHGIAFAFDRSTGELIQEQDLHPTLAGQSREWYPSGLLKAELDRPRADGTTESETWYENGQRATLESLELDVGYTPQGFLRTLRIERDCPAEDLARVSYRVDSILDLAGPGVTDEVIDRLTDLSRVEDLELQRTNISASGFKRFSNCTRLTTLRLRRNTELNEDDVRNLIEHLPNCNWDGRIS